MKIYLSPSKQTSNMYAGQRVSEAAMCNLYAQACKASLEAAGHQVVLNVAASLATRIAEANRWGAQLYVPIHTNAGGGKGVEVLVSGNGRVDAYARSICAELAAVIPSRTNRGLKPTAKGKPGSGEIYGASAPVAYVEAEFHDNPAFAAWLVANPDVVGQAVARAIVQVAGGSVPPSQPGPAERNADGSLTIPWTGLRDGRLVARWQEVMGTPVDSVVSRPRSTLIAADQRFLNAVVAHGHIKDLTGKPALDVDGDEGWRTVVVRQFWLYNTRAQEVLGRAARASDFDRVNGPQTNQLHRFALNKAAAGSGRY